MIQPISTPAGNSPAIRSGDSCAVCRFAHRLAPPPEMVAALRGQKIPDQLLCRRHPPSLTLIAVPVMPRPGILLKGGEPQAMTFANNTGFPQVAPDVWCGEFATLA